MLFRAIFWIAVVAFFMPHAEARGEGPRCAHVVCAASIGLLDRVESSLLHRLLVVRGEIEEAEHARDQR